MEQTPKLNVVFGTHSEARLLAALDGLNISDGQFSDEVARMRTQYWRERLPKGSGQNRELLVIHVPGVPRLMGYLDLAQHIAQPDPPELQPVLHPKYAELGVASALLGFAGIQRISEQAAGGEFSEVS